jgi:erythronate-4-phosphate dehydrogenase
MRIIADENMPLVAECLPGHALQRLPGRGLRREALLEADALLVRSVTRVDAALVAGTPVRFVGTATIGTDHLDLPALAGLGITVASAPGCNARAVGEWVATVLATWAAQRDRPLAGLTLGVVGLGNTGRAVLDLARVLGLRVIGCDPFVALPGVEQRCLGDLLGACDAVSLHVPLTRGGAHPTFHLLDEAALGRLRDDALLINACRGEVVAGEDLATALDARPGLVAVLDTWEGEPRVDAGLLGRVRFGSPHVAGYSQEGKWRGTAMIATALCRRFGLPAPAPLEQLLAGMPVPAPLRPQGDTPAARLASVLQQACAIGRDDAALRAAVAGPDPLAAFDALRRHYPPRREFTAHSVALAPGDPLAPLLAALGFRRED